MLWRIFGALGTEENHCRQGSSGKYVKKNHGAKITFSLHIEKNSTFAPANNPV